MKKILVLIALSFMTVSTLTAQMKDPPELGRLRRNNGCKKWTKIL